MPPAPSTRRTITAALAIEPVTKSQLKTALNNTTVPNRPPMRPHALRFICLAPAVRLDRAVGREEAEGDDREEVDDVLQVDGALAEGVEVADRSEVGDEVAHPALRLAGGPADDPG